MPKFKRSGGDILKPEIRHMVVFNLIYPKDSPEAKKFIADSVEILGAIPYCSQFDQCYEVSKKNDYDYGFSFDFEKAEDYQAYNVDPAHVKYVKERWDVEVAKFMEIDFKEIKR